MRFVLSLAIYMFITGCGAAPNRSHISEGPDEESSSHHEHSAAFHSPAGWGETISFFIESDVPSAVAEAALKAASTWNKAAGRTILKYAGRMNHERGDSLYASLDDDSTLLYFENSWTATTGKSDLILATTVWENASGNSDRIVKGDIIMNSESYLFQDSEAEIPEGKEDVVVDAETVILHEMGHLLGLTHLDDDDASVMNTYTSIGPDETKRELGETDKENIRSVYSAQ